MFRSGAMISTVIIVVLSIFLLLEFFITSLINIKWIKSPSAGEIEKYRDSVKNVTGNTLTLATFTIAILTIFFFQPGDYNGTQTLLIFGLALLFLSGFLYNFSGLGKIVYHLQKRILFYWFYSIMAAIFTLYVNPTSLSWIPSNTGIVVVLITITSLIFLFHLYSIYLEFTA